MNGESQVTISKNFWDEQAQVQDNIEEAMFGVRSAKTVLDEATDAYLSAKRTLNEALRE